MNELSFSKNCNMFRNKCFYTSKSLEGGCRISALVGSRCFHREVLRSPTNSDIGKPAAIGPILRYTQWHTSQHIETKIGGTQFERTGRFEIGIIMGHIEFES